MDLSHITAPILSVVAVLFAVAVNVWKVAASATRVEMMAKGVEDRIREQDEKHDRRFAAIGAALEELPLIRQRLGQIEHANEDLRRRVTSVYPERFSNIEKEVQVLKTKAESTDRFRAMQESRPDIPRPGR